MAFFLGIDMGTSYFKAALFDEEGVLKGLGRKPLRKCRMTARECEVSVSDFWTTLRECIEESMCMANAEPFAIQAMSYSSQANSFVLLDEKHEPLTNLTLWTDKRCESLPTSLHVLSSRHDFTSITGIGTSLSPQMCISKLLWFQEHQPLLWQKVKKVVTLADYLTFVLTGQFVTDFSTASLTGLLHVQAEEWWHEALQAANVSSSLLSFPCRTGTLIGSLSKKGAATLALPAQTKFCLGGLDHHMAAIGAGLCQQNNISESTGTVLACVRYTNQYQPGMGLFTAPGLNTGDYFQLTYHEMGAGVLEEYQKNWAPELSIENLLKEAERIPPGSSGVSLKPFAEGNPVLKFENPGSFHEHGYFVRAILESSALRLKKLADQLLPETAYERIVSTGGGARSRLWVQIKADMFGKEFLIPACSETACLGAALLAATSINHFSSVREASENWIARKDIVKPDPVAHQLYAEWVQTTIANQERT